MSNKQYLSKKEIADIISEMRRSDDGEFQLKYYNFTIIGHFENIISIDYIINNTTGYKHEISYSNTEKTDLDKNIVHFAGTEELSDIIKELYPRLLKKSDMWQTKNLDRYILNKCLSHMYTREKSFEYEVFQYTIQVQCDDLTIKFPNGDTYRIDSGSYKDGIHFDEKNKFLRIPYKNGYHLSNDDIYSLVEWLVIRHIFEYDKITDPQIQKSTETQKNPGTQEQLQKTPEIQQQDTTYNQTNLKKEIDKSNQFVKVLEEQISTKKQSLSELDSQIEELKNKLKMLKLLEVQKTELENTIEKESNMLANYKYFRGYADMNVLD